MEGPRTPKRSVSHTIHVLGLGNIGLFVAHALRSLQDPPPITLLFHRSDLHREFLRTGSKIQLRIHEDGAPDKVEFDSELLHGPACVGHNNESRISCLVLASKASATVTALEPIKHRLGKHTTICILQNGVGQEEDVNKLFPVAAERPTIIFSVVKHGVSLKSPFEPVLGHTTGLLSLGVMTEPWHSRPPSCDFLLEALTRPDILRCTEYEWREFQRIQLLKLSASCVINPLTALLDTRIGVLGEDPTAVALGRYLIAEASAVIRNLPQFKPSPGDQSLFGADNLVKNLAKTIAIAPGNPSSMCKDVQNRRSTEIQYLNGWIVRQGKKLGIDCPFNSFLTNLILARTGQRSELQEAFQRG